MKSKEEILDDNLGDTIEYPHYDLNDFQRRVVLGAMDEYAMESGLEFLKWVSETAEKTIGNLWIIKEELGDFSYTAKELYFQFLKRQIEKS